MNPRVHFMLVALAEGAGVAAFLAACIFIATAGQP